MIPWPVPHSRRVHLPLFLEATNRVSGPNAVRLCKAVSLNKIEQKALSLLTTFENAGRSVRRVSVEGRRIEIELVTVDNDDDFERIEMRYGKT